MTAHFITFGSGKFYNAAAALAENASRVGFTSATVLVPQDFEGTSFARRNAQTLSLERGAGYWVWKPYLIRRAVENLGPGEFLLYSDAGRSSYYQFSRVPSALLSEVRRHGQGFLVGAAIGHLGNIETWTKRDCLEIMSPDADAVRRKPIIQATWSIWSRSSEAINFLEDWLRYSEDPRCLTDQPNVLGKENFASFVSHRHDQSICSILAHQRCAPFVDSSKTRVHRLMELRPRSELGNTFYKRFENCDDLLCSDRPWLLLREFWRLRRLR